MTVARDLIKTVSRSEHGDRLPSVRASLGRRAARSRVLVTDGGERSALAIVRSLGRTRRHEVFVCSDDGRSLAGVSKFARADWRIGSALDDPIAYAQELAMLARRIDADFVLPV